ncbi:ribonuclease H-like protein [Hypomontagnella monticulosa]|nr:ribonuclease H-like protein [Hypomontagnella monticulosa]
MAQGKGPRQYRCDCALTFPNVQSVGEHVKQTGHMKARWCTLCYQLFSKKDTLEQHKKTATKHKNDPTISPEAPVLPKINVPVNKPQTKTVKPAVSSNKPTTTSNKAVAVVEVSKAPKAAKPLKAAGTVKGKKKTAKSSTQVANPTIINIQTTQKPPKVAAMSKEPAPVVVVAPVDPIALAYPWASGEQYPSMAASLVARCHEESCLWSRGYYTGDQKRVRFNIKKFLPTPPRTDRTTKRKAIAVDCEMVGISNGKDELARICAVDMLTREVLIDAFVIPTEVVKDWRTKYSGVTQAKINEAKANGTALDGWPVARAKLFEFADASTVLVGHSLNHDLRVLHVAHKRVVDSGMLVAEAVFGKGRKLLRGWGLKACCQELLGITIQSSKNGHDCMEDTLATREVVLWCVNERPKLLEWAKQALVDFEAERKERAERQRALAKAEAERQRKLQQELQQTAHDQEMRYTQDELKEMGWEEYFDGYE